MTNIALGFNLPGAIFATRLSCELYNYFIQTGGSALSNAYNMILATYIEIFFKGGCIRMHFCGSHMKPGQSLL